MGKKFFTEDDLGIGYIDEQIQINYNNVTEEFNHLATSMEVLSNSVQKRRLIEAINKVEIITDDHYDKINNISVEGINNYGWGDLHTPHGETIALETIGDFINNIKTGIYKIIKKIIDAIKKMFKWIGKKLGFIKDEVSTVKETNDEIKYEIPKQEKTISEVNDKIDEVTVELTRVISANLSKGLEVSNLELKLENLKSELEKEKTILDNMQKHDDKINDDIDKGRFFTKEQLTSIQNMFTTLHHLNINWLTYGKSLDDILRHTEFYIKHEVDGQGKDIYRFPKYTELSDKVSDELPKILMSSEYVVNPLPTLFNSFDFYRITKIDNNNIGIIYGGLKVKQGVKIYTWSSKFKKSKELKDIDESYILNDRMTNRVNMVLEFDKILTGMSKKDQISMFKNIIDKYIRQMEGYIKDTEDEKIVEVHKQEIIEIPKAMLSTYISYLRNRENLIKVIKIS